MRKKILLSFLITWLLFTFNITNLFFCYAEQHFATSVLLPLKVSNANVDKLQDETVVYASGLSKTLVKSRQQASKEFFEQKKIDKQEGTLTVATFNVLTRTSKRFLGNLTYIPLAKQFTTILMTKAQVVGLNEINSRTDFNAPELYSINGIYEDNVFGSNAIFQGYDYGNLIESTYIASRKRVGKYLPVANTERRCYTNIVINVGAKKVSVYSTHLDFTSKAIVESQLAQLYAIVSADKTKYKIVMGDMNTNKLSSFKLFTDAGYKMVNTGQYLTYNSKSALDHIIVSPNIDIISSGMITVTNVKDDITPKKTSNYGISDHNPIWARLRFN